MCLCDRRSASSAAYASTRLHSLLSGRSTDVDTFSRIVVCPSICLRMDSTEACERKKRLVSALSSRNSPSSKCSVSMYGDPNWLASYRAKKITRLAFSVYLSNRRPPNGNLCAGGIARCVVSRCTTRCAAQLIVLHKTCDAKSFLRAPQRFAASPSGSVGAIPGAHFAFHPASKITTAQNPDCVLPTPAALPAPLRDPCRPRAEARECN